IVVVLSALANQTVIVLLDELGQISVARVSDNARFEFIDRVLGSHHENVVRVDADLFIEGSKSGNFVHIRNGADKDMAKGNAFAKFVGGLEERGLQVRGTILFEDANNKNIRSLFNGIGELRLFGVQPRSGANL